MSLFIASIILSMMLKCRCTILKVLLQHFSQFPHLKVTSLTPKYLFIIIPSPLLLPHHPLFLLPPSSSSSSHITSSEPVLDAVQRSMHLQQGEAEDQLFVSRGSTPGLTSVRVWRSDSEAVELQRVCRRDFLRADLRVRLVYLGEGRRTSRCGIR